MTTYFNDNDYLNDSPQRGLTQPGVCIPLSYTSLNRLKHKHVKKRKKTKSHISIHINQHIFLYNFRVHKAVFIYTCSTHYDTHWCILSNGTVFQKEGLQVRFETYDWILSAHYCADIIPNFDTSLTHNFLSCSLIIFWQMHFLACLVSYLWISLFFFW